jgi:hypothetical protein
VPKVPIITYFALGFSALVVICAGFISALVYNDRKSLKKELGKII